jgi:hypothetical protein
MVNGDRCADDTESTVRMMKTRWDVREELFRIGGRGAPS